MRRWSIRRILALLFTVLMTVSPSLSIVQAGDMATRMAMPFPRIATDGDHQGCLAGRCNEGMNVLACAAVCQTPTLATLPADPRAVVLVSASFVVGRYVLLIGRASQPDPYPPRLAEIG